MAMELTSRSALSLQIKPNKFVDISSAASLLVPCCRVQHGLTRHSFSVRLGARIDRRFAERRSRSVQVVCSSNFDDSAEVAKLFTETIPGDGELASRSRLNGSLERHSQEVENGGGGGGDGNGKSGSGGGGGGEGGDDGGGDELSDDDKEFGPLLNSEQVQQELQARGVTLPTDMMEAAKTVGIRKLFLDRFFELQGGLLGKAMNASSPLRNRMLADPTFLFKVFTEIAIDSGCATAAEIQKRGKDFWNEFDFYLADLLVGIALDVLLVGLLAPFVRFGAAPVGNGASAKLSRAIQALPSSIFEAQRPGRTFSMGQRVSTLFYKAGQYGVAGFSCGLIGQGIASGVMVLKRKLKKNSHEEEELKVPNVLTSAALWAVFMGVSSNTRYQIINGMERVVEASVLSKKVPQVAMAFTVSVRLANNFFGAGQFVDWARLAGVQ